MTCIFARDGVEPLGGVAATSIGAQRDLGHDIGSAFLSAIPPGRDQGDL
jgi:hypothetical protein